VDRALIAALLLGVLALAVLALRARRGRAPERVEPAELGLTVGAGVGVVEFSSPYCRSCQRWEAALSEAGVPFSKVDVSERPDLARRYRVGHTPLILAVRLPAGDVTAAFDGDPEPGDLERIRGLVAARS
jgi:hypothetical protein